MSRKAVISTWAVLLLLSVGCARVRETSAPRESAVSATLQPATPEKTIVTRHPPRRTAPHSRARPAPTPRTASAQPGAVAQPPDSRHSDLPSLINANSIWTANGRSLVVSRDIDTPVPLFRQAIVLAAVRDALADSPIEPKAEFLKGTLTLTFDKGTSVEMARDINRTIAIPEVARLAVLIGG